MPSKTFTLELEALRKSLTSAAVITPESEEYEQKLKRWSETAEKKAAVIVCPTTPEEVSKAVIFCQENRLEVAVCGGGHSTNGSSSTDGGLVIDLSAMRKVTVSLKEQTITSQGGALWQDVDEAAGRYGLATVGGTVNHTGVGGLTLGGGYGWLTGQYGLVIDNLISVTMVLADGSIVEASNHNNPDLFWAVRGAGQSFGVAVEFKFRAYEQKDPVWSGVLMYPMDKLPEIVAFVNQFGTMSAQCGMAVAFTSPPPFNGAIAICVVPFYNGPESDALKLFAPILQDISPVVNHTSAMPYSSVNGVLNKVATHGDRKVLKSSTFVTPLKVEFLLDIMEDFEAFLSKVPDSSSSIVLLELFHYSKVIEIPQTETSFPNRGQYYNMVMNPRWKSPAYDTSARDFARDIAMKFTKEKERMINEGHVKLSVSGVGEYPNHDALGASPKQLYGPNIERLLALKAKYDPRNVFAKYMAFMPKSHCQ